MDRFLKKVAAHANAKLPADQRIHLHAHKLRHTSVKKVHDKKGPLEAKKFSGHRSFKQLERYATSTTPEHEDMVDGLFS
jgi:integrase/recombinase XerD